MRAARLALVVGLLISLAASTALAEEPSLRRTLSAQAEAPWAPVADGDYVRSYAPSLATAPQKRWRAVVAAYLWATSIDGTSWSDGVPTDLDIEFSDLFDKLESAFMGYAEFGYERWSLAIDASFVSLEAETPGLRGQPITVNLDQTIVDLRLGYTVLCRPVGSSQWGCCCYPRHMTLDAIVGARHWCLDTELTATLPQTGAPVSVSNSEGWWDPYVGARFRWPFSKRWGLLAYGDIGGFGIEDASELTWQLQVLLKFQITRGLFVGLGYRAIDVDRVEGSGAARNGVDATYHGPIIGLGYSF